MEVVEEVAHCQLRQSDNCDGEGILGDRPGRGGGGGGGGAPRPGGGGRGAAASSDATFVFSSSTVEQ